MTTSYDQRNHIVGLEKGLAVIVCFDETHQKLTIAEVAQAVGLSRAAARRCLLTLTRLGYAEYDGKFFRLTVHAMRLGYAYLASTTTTQILQTAVERLSGETNESCSAAVLDGNEMVYVARAAVKRILSISVNVGTRLPLYCTSMGKVLLAALEPEAAENSSGNFGFICQPPPRLRRGSLGGAGHLDVPLEQSHRWRRNDSEQTIHNGHLQCM